jgi:hypothetical protein
MHAGNIALRSTGSALHCWMRGHCVGVTNVNYKIDRKLLAALRRYLLARALDMPGSTVLVGLLQRWASRSIVQERLSLEL